MAISTGTTDTQSGIYQARQIAIQNDSGEMIPAYSFARITGVDANGVATIIKPNADNLAPGLLVITGAMAIPVDAYSVATPAETGKLWVIISGSDPSVGSEFGTVAGQWYGKGGKTGFIVAGTRNSRAFISAIAAEISMRWIARDA